MFKKRLSLPLMLLALASLGSLTTLSVQATTGPQSYTATWASVDQHPPAAEWFQDAKFGLWYHWGAFSVPAYGSEWYPRHMYLSGSSEYNHHLSVFGDPYTNWPYANFINGANNKSGVFTKFAPKLKSQGGNFDPNEWAQLFYDAGAKMAGPVAEHHDGFSMWDSTVNEWNSVDKGPGLDLVGLFATAYRAKGLKYLVSSHAAYNFTGYYQYVPAQTDASLKKLYGQLGTTAEEQLWVDKLKELVDLYQPDYIWHDFNVKDISEAKRLEFLAYYYNKAVAWNKDVVVSFNDGYNIRGEIQQYERGGPGAMTYPFWLTEDSVSSTTWSYTAGMGYYSTKAMLHSLIDRVSKNGSLLLNIAPLADGTIPQAQKDILLGMGNWLRVYGEAIYATRAWDKFGEGPTAMGGGTFMTPVEGAAADIRFTRNKAQTALYAIAMGWPANNQMVITSLGTGKFNTATLTSITLLGTSGNLTWTQDSAGLKINLPSGSANPTGYAVKLSFSGAIPALITPAYTQTEAEMYAVNSGAVRAEACGEGGMNLGWMTTGDYVVFKNVDFGAGATGFQARLAGVSTSGKIDLRLDSPTGTLIGTLNGFNTGGWQTYTTASTTVSGASGVHNLYMVFTAGLNLNWFKFTGGSSATPTPTPTPSSSTYYSMANVKSAKVIDVPGCSTANSIQLNQWSWLNNNCQKFQFVANGSYYNIKNANSGKCLDVNNASTADGATIVQYTCGSGTNQQFSWVASGSAYLLKARHSGKCVGVYGASTADGAGLVQWTCNGSTDQAWTRTAR